MLACSQCKRFHELIQDQVCENHLFIQQQEDSLHKYQTSTDTNFKADTPHFIAYIHHFTSLSYFIIVTYYRLMKENKIKCDSVQTVSRSQIQPVVFTCKKFTVSDQPWLGQLKEPKMIDQTQKQKILSKEYPEYQQTSNLLPINFSNSVTAYNKLLITNGRRIMQQKQSVFEPQDLQSLNIPIFKRKQQERAEILSSQKSIPTTKLQQATNCSCCCCDKYCRMCEQQMKASQRQKSSSSISFIKSRGSSNSKITVSKQANPQQKLPTNKSEISRRQKLQKIKQKMAKEDVLLQARNQEKFERIRPIIQRSLRRHMSQSRQKEYESNVKRKNVIVAMQQIRQFAERVQIINQHKIKHTFSQKYQWGINQPSVKKENAKRVAMKMYAQESEPHRRSKASLQLKELKVDPPQQLCHPKCTLSNQAIKRLKKKHLMEAIKEIKDQKRMQLQAKKKKQLSLKELESKRLDIINANPKIQFRRASKQVELKTFCFVPEQSPKQQKKKQAK